MQCEQVFVFVECEQVFGFAITMFFHRRLTSQTNRLGSVPWCTVGALDFEDRVLLVLPRPLNFLSSHNQLMRAKGHRIFLRASWHMMSISRSPDSGLGFLTSDGGCLTPGN